MSEAEGLDRGEPLFASHENHLRYPIDAFFPIDLESGLLNRNGLVESIRRCMLWWDRRREQFEVLAVYLPWVEEVAPAERPALVRQLAATMSATVRRVDEAGRIDDATYVVVLRDFHREGITEITERIRTSIGADAEPRGFDPVPRLGFCLASSGDLIPSAYLDAAIDAAHRAAAEPEVVEAFDR